MFGWERACDCEPAAVSASIRSTRTYGMRLPSPEASEESIARTGALSPAETNTSGHNSRRRPREAAGVSSLSPRQRRNRCAPSPVEQQQEASMTMRDFLLAGSAALTLLATPSLTRAQPVD